MSPKKKLICIIILTIIVTLIVVALSGILVWSSFQTKIVSILTSETRSMCEKSSPVDYRKTLQLPPTNGVYDHGVATALKDISANVSQANCQDVTIPPPFTNFEIFTGRYGGDWRDGTMYAIGFWSPNLDYACVGFTGTYFRTQWLNDMKVGFAKCDQLDGFKPEMKLHKGFYLEYLSIRERLRDWWLKLKTSGIGVRHLFLTGSSMGGALSTIAAFDLADLVDGQMIHYSFASPRVGSVIFAEEYNRRVPTGIRVFNTEDLVVGVPPAIGTNSYMHVGAPSQLQAFTKSLYSITANHVDAYFELP